jgi:hypothetical protein
MIQLVAELNEDAVYELAAGKSECAIILLEKATRVLMEVCQKSNMQRKRHASPASDSVYRASSVEIPYLLDDVFYVYNYTMTFSLQTTKGASSEPRTKKTSQNDMIAVYGSSILFNLALAYHQQGKITGELSSFQRAFYTYQECYNALQALPPHLQQHHPFFAEDICLMTLAALNNQAQIAHELGEEVTATNSMQGECCSNMSESVQTLFWSSLSKMMEDDCTYLQNLSAFEQSQIQEFVQNAMAFQHLRCCAAACA